MAPRAVSSGRGDSARPCAAAHCRPRAQRRHPCLVSTFRPGPPLMPRSERPRNPTPPEQPTNRGGWARAPRALRKYLRTTTDLVLRLGWTLGAPCHRARTQTVATKPAKPCQAESTYAGSEACGSTCGAACAAAILPHASAVSTWPSLPRARAKVLAPQAQRCATVGTARRASRRPRLRTASAVAAARGRLRRVVPKRRRGAPEKIPKRLGSPRPGIGVSAGDGPFGFTRCALKKKAANKMF
jgi:hypothetical protein